MMPQTMKDMTEKTLIQKTTPEQTLLKLAKEGALYVKPEKDFLVDQPIQGKEDDLGLGLHDILKTLIKSANPEKCQAFANLTESQLASALQSIIPDHKDLGEGKNGMIQPPPRFGNENMSEKDLSELRLIKKDSKEANIEFSLNLLNQFLTDKQCKFTEQSVIRNMYILVPPSTVQYLSVIMQRENISLKEIYREMIQKFGSSKSNADITNNIYAAVSKSKNALQLVHSVADLIDMAREDRNALTILGVQETENYIKRFYDPAIASTIKLWYCMKGGDSYRTYATIVDEQFAHVLAKDIDSRTQVHNLNDSANPVGSILTDTLQLMSRLNDKVDKMEQNMHQNMHFVQTGMQQQSSIPLTCHLCRKTGHFKKDCPQKRGASSMSRSGKNVYCDQLCSIHTNGKHSNKECRTQASKPCLFAENHKHHTMNYCRRNVSQQTQAQGVQGAKLPPQPVAQDVNPIMAKLAEVLDKLNNK